jgi:hypothetical protein
VGAPSKSIFQMRSLILFISQEYRRVSIADINILSRKIRDNTDATLHVIIFHLFHYIFNTSKSFKIIDVKEIYIL